MLNSMKLCSNMCYIWYTLIILYNYYYVVLYTTNIRLSIVKKTGLYILNTQPRILDPPVDSTGYVTPRCRFIVQGIHATKVVNPWLSKKKPWSLNHHRLVIHLSLLGWPWAAPSPASMQWDGLLKTLVPERGQGSCSSMSGKRSHLSQSRVSRHSSIQMRTFSCSYKSSWQTIFLGSL